MFDKLQAMLVRSRSCLFRLRIPHRNHGIFSIHCHRLLGLEQLDIRRLVSYDGPLDIFAKILDQTPLPTLTSLNLIESDYKWDTADLILTGPFSGNGLPNLVTLRAGYIRFSPDSCPFPALEHLGCSLHDDRDIVRLFDAFPNVVSLQINNVEPTVPFPAVSLPPSLRTIVLCSFGRSDLYVYWTLQHWVGVRIPRLVAPNAGSTRGFLTLFAAMHPHPVNLRLNSRDGEIVLSTPGEELMWTITPTLKRRDTFLVELEKQSCARLTSVSVALEQLGRLFAAQLQLPGLERLEFGLDGVQETPLLRVDRDGFVIRAPRLQHVVFAISGIGASTEETHAVLALLRMSFRTLIVYDAELLSSITLSAPATCAQAIDCADFTCFTKDYRVCVAG